jgi:ankyrin repeat protein
MLSLIADHTDVARLLIEAGADLNIRSSRTFGAKTALVLARDGGYGEIVSLLESEGATE